MMHDQPNNPEYCQGIYEAAKRVVEWQEENAGYKGLIYKDTMENLVANLKRALEGKP